MRALLSGLLLLLACGPSSAQLFELGGLYTYHYRDGRYADWGDYALQGAHIAIDAANASGLLGEDRIRLLPQNTIDYHCWPENAALMAETLMRKDILVLTGADCSGPAVEIARVGERFGVPVISNGANASELSSTEDFPWFLRVVTPSEAYEGYLVDLAARFGVKEIAHFHTTDAWGLGARAVIAERAATLGIRIAERFAFPRDTPQAKLEAWLAIVEAAGIRHIFMTGPTPDTVTLFRAIDALAMNQPGTTLYAAEMISADEGPEAVRGSLGYFAPMTQLEDSAALRRFRAALEARLGSTVDPNGKAFFYGALSHDHILAVAHAIHDLKARGESVERASMMTALRRVDFEGATGRVRFRPGSNDRADMPVALFNSHGFGPDGTGVRFVPIGSVDPRSGSLDLDPDAILWPGGTRTAPVGAASVPSP
jgi:ABC-type branched-subunit amino acid transport system substrate-binding protein